jgi:hypothetical protein
MLGVAKSMLGVAKSMLGVAKSALGGEKLAPGAARWARDRPKSFLGAMRRVLIALKNKAWQAAGVLLKMRSPPKPPIPQPPKQTHHACSLLPFLSSRGIETNKPKPEKMPMTQDQDNIVAMFNTTIAFLDEKNSVWSGTPAFVDAVARATTGAAAINTSGDIQETPTSGVTVDKADARADLEEKTLEIADQLSALAAKNSDNDLGAKVEMTKSSLDKMKDKDLEQTAERVAGLATTNIAALAAYDVTAADVTALTTARTTFAEIMTGPGLAGAVRTAQTVSLPHLIAKERSIFRNEIDKMVTKKKKTNPDFYAGYFAARVIVNRPATHAAPKPPAPPAPPKP